MIFDGLVERGREGGEGEGDVVTRHRGSVGRSITWLCMLMISWGSP